LDTTVLIFHELPQRIDGIHSFCTIEHGFLLDEGGMQGAQLSTFERDVL